jgi:SRSO17 transposase
MDAERIARLGPMLSAYLHRFEDCFVRREQPRHLRRIVMGQLSDLPRKSLEPIALAGGCPPRTLQQFLSLHGWDHERVREKVQRLVGREHAHRHSIGLLDETAHPKKGGKTPGTQRQWCGTKGTTDNCAVTVHLGYAAADFHCLIDSELFLPESWSHDRERCREAGIPQSMTYRPKTGIALELWDRAVANGVRFEWMTFDEGYGKEPAFLHGLNRRGQRFVAEVPPTFYGWLKEPPVMLKEFPGRASYESSGRNRKFPRLKVKAPRSCAVESLLRRSPVFRDQPWEKYHIKDTQKGPMVWEVKAAPLYFKQEKAITFAHWLVVCRSPITGDVKYFISNAPKGTPLEAILHVAFARWRVETCFQEEKSELGLSHFEVRNYTSLLRHLILTSVSHLFLAEVKERWRAARGERRAPDRPADQGRGDRAGTVPLVGRSGATPLSGEDGRQDQLRPTEHPGRSPVSRPGHTRKTRSPRHRPTEAQMLLPPIEKVAL